MGGAITGSGQSRNQSLMAGNTVQIEGVLDGNGLYGLLSVVLNGAPRSSFLRTMMFLTPKSDITPAVVTDGAHRSVHPKVEGDRSRARRRGRAAAYSFASHKQQRRGQFRDH